MKRIRKEKTLNTGLEFDSVQDVSDNIHILAISTVSDEVDAAHAVVADILMFDKEQNRKFILKSDTDFSKYPADRYAPIGVVVVPGTHNVYDDGSCGVMSLKAMNCDTSSEGGTSDEQFMYWGVQGTNISGLRDLG